MRDVSTDGLRRTGWRIVERSRGWQERCLALLRVIRVSRLLFAGYSHHSAHKYTISIRDCSTSHTRSGTMFTNLPPHPTCPSLAARHVSTAPSLALTAQCNERCVYWCMTTPHPAFARAAFCQAILSPGTESVSSRQSSPLALSASRHARQKLYPEQASQLPAQR